MPHHEPIRKRSGGAGPGSGTPSEIPDKLYFRIGEVAKLCEVPAYVLRFWEGEFPQLKPNKGGTGQRLYRRRDVEMALRVKTLLYDEGYTIPGARLALKSEPRAGKDPRDPQPPGPAATSGLPAAAGDARLLTALRKELQDLHTLLLNPAAMLSAKSTAGSPVRSIRPPRPVSAPRPAPTPFPRSTLTLERRPDLFSDLDPD